MTKSRFSTTALFLIFVGLFLTGVSSVLADENNSDVGTSAFNFLKIEVAARPIAMGGAYTGVADDESSLFYNPAGLASLNGRHLIFGYHNYVFDMQAGFLGYIHPLGAKQKVAVFADYLNYGDFIRADNEGVPEGTFSGSDILFGVGYARVINDDFSVGGNVKLIYEKIDEYSASGFAVDLGGKYILPDRRTSVGLAIMNLGAQFSNFIETSEKDKLPLLFRAGVSNRPKGLPVLVAADVIYPTDNDIYVALGLEYLEVKPLFLRVGWTSFGENYKTGSSKDDFAGFSAGFGIDVSDFLSFSRMQISYALTPQAELGTSHRVTLSGGFDPL